MIVSLAGHTQADGHGVSAFVWAAVAMVVVPVLRKVLEKWIDTVAVRTVLRRARRVWRFVVHEVFLRGSSPNRFARTLARWLQAWLRRLPDVPEERLAILDPNVHEMGARLVLVNAVNLWWGVSTSKRREDHTLQVGFWLRPAGLATIALGCQAWRHGQPWGVHDLVVGVTLALVGQFLGSLRLTRLLVFALPAIGPLLFVLSSRFHVPHSTGLAGIATEKAMLVGAVAAAVAGMIVFLQVLSADVALDEDRSQRRLDRGRLRAISFSMRCCRAACWAFGVANVLQAVTFAPTAAMKATHVVIALLLSFTASETFKKPNRYRRLYRGV